MAQNLFSRRRQTKRKQKNKRHTNDFLEASVDPSSLRTLTPEKLSHEGRGIAKHKGKTQFVEGALVGETVQAKLLKAHNTYDELQTVEILTPSPDRIEPFCEHFDLCGGCSLQNMSPNAQLSHKMEVLKEQYAHFGQVDAMHWLAPIESSPSAYRSKARLGVYFDSSANKTIIGFREKQSKRLTDIQQCPILEDAIACLIPTLHELMPRLEGHKSITHIELAHADTQKAMVIRHVASLSEHDIACFTHFSDDNDVRIYLQERSGQQAKPLGNSSAELSYSIDTLQTPSHRSKTLTLAFHPQDFTQVNTSVNQQLITQALAQLDLKATDRVLDLFCGLGNFTLPAALNCQQVVGVEGSDAMVSRASKNAENNQINNVQFYSADLHADFRAASWAKQTYNKILIDPPRAGALVVSNFLHHFDAERIVYISCNPATLARDAGVLSGHGYRLETTGVIDMFPNTEHIESIAVFVRQKKR